LFIVKVEIENDWNRHFFSFYIYINLLILFKLLFNRYIINLMQPMHYIVLICFNIQIFIFVFLWTAIEIIMKQLFNLL